MNVRKYMVLVVGGSIALVILIVMAVMLWRFSGEYVRVQSELKASTSALERLQNRDPYPADDNVERLDQNLAVMEEMLDVLLEDLASGQIDPEDMERAAFPTLVERTIRGLYEYARDADMRLPERFTFGFERYAMGALPQANHIPRLTVQVRMIERLCRLLADAGVDEIVSIDRPTFDVDAPEERDLVPRRRGVPEADDETPPGFTDLAPRREHDLYSKERFAVTFYSSDVGLWQTLNALASSDMFVVIKNVELANEDDLRGRSPRELRRRPDEDRRTDRDRERPRTLAADDRVVAGRERVRVRLELEIYRFELEGWGES